MSETQYGIPYPGPMPSPTPEHQRRIFKEKAFEIVTVVVLIIAGFSFLAWRNYQSNQAAAALTINDVAAVIQDASLIPSGTTTLHARTFHGFTKPMGNFTCNVDLIGVGGDDPLETCILWLTPQAGEWPPAPEALQDVVNNVRQLAISILPASAQALEAAVTTSEFLSDAPRPHDKGVAATNNAWRLTYVTYRSFDETAEPQPVLVLVLQRLSAGENPELGTMNRILFDAIQKGNDIKTALRDQPPGP